MNLIVSSRPSGKKTEIKKLRRDGKIPAVLYSSRSEAKHIVVDRLDFSKSVNSVEPGTISTKIFKLNLGDKSVDAILKEIQYSKTTYDVIHLDFEELHKGVPVTVNVPIQCINVAECVGVKIGGGFLRQIVRHVTVRCDEPNAIPRIFELDVRDLGLHQTKKFADIDIPANVKPITDLKTVVVVVSKR